MYKIWKYLQKRQVITIDNCPWIFIRSKILLQTMNHYQKISWISVFQVIIAWINIYFYLQEKWPRGSLKACCRWKLFAFCDADLCTIIWVDTLTMEWKLLNVIHLPYNHDSNNINGIHISFFMLCTKFCIVKIVKWDYFGIMIIEK